MTKRVLLATILLAATPAFAQSPSPSVEVQNAWARATAAGAKAGGVFLTLTDKGAPDRLIGASTPVAATAEVHETVNEKGIMRMRPVPALPLQSNDPLVLKPGGYHLMLMGLKQQLKEGQTFAVTLNFEKAGNVTTTVHVGKAGAMGPGMMSMP